jgi:hypothetical protein
LSHSWVLIVLTGVLIISVFGGILWHERRKYGAHAAVEPEIKKKETAPSQMNLRSDLSRLKYDLAIARERNDPKLFLSSAEKIIAAAVSEGKADPSISAVKADLFALRYGGQLCTGEIMAELEERILSLSGY